MRFGLSLAVLGFMLGGMASSALAQQQQQQQPSYVYGGNTNYAAPIYNTPSAYRDQVQGGSIYNSGANLRMLPMQQMVAGQNAPSYRYGGNNASQPYNFNNYNGNPNQMGGLTPAQARAARAQRNANAAAYQQQYLDSLNQRNANNPYANVENEAQQMVGSQYQGSQFSQLYAENAQPKKQVKRKVIYNQLNNPLVDPPRLFNPDQ